MNEEFACALLSEHVRAFQMQKNSQSMDCFSLAIQVYNPIYALYMRTHDEKIIILFINMIIFFRRY